MRSAFLSEPKVAALRAINYAPELEALSRPKNGSRSAPLRSLLSSFGESYWAVFTRHDCQREHGVELITQVDMFAAEPEGRVIRRDSMPSPDQHEVKRWQVLIAGAGQMGEGNLFGRCIIADGRLAGKYLGPHAVALTLPDSDRELNAWLYAFLNTAVGFKAIKACAFGTSVPGLRLDLLAEIPVPMPSDQATVRRVAALVGKTMEQREAYQSELAAARRVVESLPEMREAHEMCSARKRRLTSWSGPLPTLCAWNLASTGDALGYLRRTWSKRLGDALVPDGLFRGPRSSRIRCSAPYGVEFLSQRDAFLIRPFPRRIALPPVDPRLLFAPEGTIMVGAQGTLGEGEVFGRAMMIHGRLERSALTEHLPRLMPLAAESRSLFAFFTTVVGMRLLRSTGVGTKLLSMRPDLLRDLPVPELSNGQTRLIDAHVAASIHARETADEAEEEAIRILEEDVLPAWLG